MDQKSSGRPPDHGILKKEMFGYAGICLMLLLFLGIGGMLVRTFPVKGVLGALCYLVVGGLGMSAGIFWFRPEAEWSEFFKTFNLLYHPGIWILAMMGLTFVIGFLVAGVIVLVVILRGSRM